MTTKSEWCRNLSIIDVYNDFSGFFCEDPSKTVKCPFHEDSNPSMKLYSKNNHWICFGCGKQGSPIDFIMELKRVDFVEAIHILCDFYGYSAPASEIRNAEAYNKVKRFHEITEAIADRFAANKTDYWSKRGISEKVQKEYKLGFAPTTLKFDPSKDLSLYTSLGLCAPSGTSTYAGRYIIPIMDQYGFICGFAGRGNDPKYINSSDCEYFHKSEVLYNYHVARCASKIYVVEGYLDALSMITAGHKNVVATMGTAFSDAGIKLLQGKEVVLAFDSDEAGKMATYNAIRKNRDSKFTVLNPLSTKDLNELLVLEGIDAVNTAIQSTIDGVAWFIDYVLSNHDLTNAEDQDDCWKIVAKLIGAIETPYQDEYPLNTLYTPVAIRRYWNYFYSKLNEEV